MEIEKILAFIIGFLALVSLIVLLFVTTLPIAKLESKEREKRIKMYEDISKYIDFKIRNGDK